ncbi:hypothetical protein B0T14DRAFT_507813 [Immersiella caudata]|uniref:Uncharacterized protein n=1 Tax=Immersiella caudata TaxID=314043 RepID=A0AA39XGV7_9PEZI|nr:hypothetical protein B0T14DRAFT_507813 [Immersiella caudata]
MTLEATKWADEEMRKHQTCSSIGFRRVQTLIAQANDLATTFSPPDPLQRGRYHSSFVATRKGCSADLCKTRTTSGKQYHLVAEEQPSYARRASAMAFRAGRIYGVQYREPAVACRHLDKRQLGNLHKGSLHCTNGGSTNMHSRVAASTSAGSALPVTSKCAVRWIIGTVKGTPPSGRQLLDETARWRVRPELSCRRDTGATGGWDCCASAAWREF